MAGTESITISVEEFEWNLKLLLTVVCPKGIYIDAISDIYMKYFNKIIKPSMLLTNSKYWISVFDMVPVLCKTFELYERNDSVRTYVKVRTENLTANSDDDSNQFMQKVLALASYEKTVLLTNDNRSTPESNQRKGVNCLLEEQMESDSSISVLSASSSETHISSSEEETESDSEEESESTANKRKRIDLVTATQSNHNPVNSHGNELSPNFSIIFQTPKEFYIKPPDKQLARRYMGPTYPPGKVKSFLFSYKLKDEERSDLLCTQNYPNDDSAIISSDNGDTVFEMGGTKYVTGYHRGSDPVKASRVVKIYNHGKRRKAPNLIQPTMNASACILNDSLYMVGGEHLDKSLDTLQRLKFKIKHKKWRLLKNMNCTRTELGLAVVGDHIYAIGGRKTASHEDEVDLKSGEFYTPKNNSWESIPDMQVPRSRHKMGVVDNLIYAISGHRDKKRTMEQYNCELKTWNTMADLLPKYSIRSEVAVTSNNLLFLLGKEYSSTNYFMDVYDPRINQWNSFPDLHDHLKIDRPDADFITYFSG